MATVTLTSDYIDLDNLFSQDTIALETLKMILGDGIGDIPENLEFFGINLQDEDGVVLPPFQPVIDGWSSAGLTLSKNTALNKTFEWKEGDPKVDGINNSYIFTGKNLDSANYRINSFNYSENFGASTLQPNLISLITSGEMKGLISKRGMTITSHKNDFTYIELNQNNFLAVGDGYAFPQKTVGSSTFNGEHFQNWDGSVMAREVRGLKWSEDFSHEYFDSFEKKKTNSNKKAHEITSKEGFEVQAEGLVFNDEGSPTSIERIDFDGVVDSINISVSTKWSFYDDSPQGTGTLTYKSTEKNVRIADAFNSVFDEVISGSFPIENLEAEMVAALLPALFFGNDVITVKSLGGYSDEYQGTVYINGYGGNDKITGGKGDDIIVGGKGKDTLAGGSGSDVFEFYMGDSAVISGRMDSIADFKLSDQDTLFLGGIVPTTNYDEEVATSVAEARINANEAFYLDCNVFVQRFKRDVLLFADMNGDDVSDLGVQLLGVAATDALWNSFKVSLGSDVFFLAVA